jgi:hypothetical protein
LPVALHGRPAGHLPWFDDELVRALDLLDLDLIVVPEAAKGPKEPR